MRLLSPLVLALAGFGLASCESSVAGPGSPGAPDAEALVNPMISDAAPVVVPDAEPVVEPCLEGDIQVTDPGDGTCYMLLNGPHTYAGALLACAALNATLASIESQEEQALVATLAAQYPVDQPDLWLGATDILVENTFIWADLKPFTYTHWRLGEPNNGNGGTPENCAIIEGDNAAAEWDDRPCIRTYPAICKR